VLIMPAWQPGGRLGIKTVNVFAANADRGLPALHATYLLFDATTGVPLAQLDGSEITTRRTVAASALAASYLARPDATRLLVVGAGRLAREVPAAMRSVRPSIGEIRVWNHQPARAEALAQDWRAQGLPALAVTDLEAAVRSADIVSCVTLSTAPLVQGRGWARARTWTWWAASRRRCARPTATACAARACGSTPPRRWPSRVTCCRRPAEGAFDPAATQGTLADLCRGTAAGACGRRDHPLQVGGHRAGRPGGGRTGVRWERRDADPTGRRAGDPGGGGGAVLHRGAEVELLDRRACRLGAEAVEEGLGLQDLGRRTGHGLAARVDPEKFHFTIFDDEVAETISKAMGKRVSLHYEEKVGLPSSCFGETRHYVTGVTVSDEIPLAPGVMVPNPPAARRPACRQRHHGAAPMPASAPQ
jgi:ornithine cyclodeaminase/alanine dehydrogenase-like protein (mu-crystallin family)